MSENPLYTNNNSFLARFEYEQRQGEIELSKHGYAIGDTVYLDGTLKAIIDFATVSTSMFGMPDELIIFLTVAAKAYWEYTGEVEHEGVEFVGIPCTLSNIQKEGPSHALS